MGTVEPTGTKTDDISLNKHFQMTNDSSVENYECLNHIPTHHLVNVSSHVIGQEGISQGDDNQCDKKYEQSELCSPQLFMERSTDPVLTDELNEADAHNVVTGVTERKIDEAREDEYVRQTHFNRTPSPRNGQRFLARTPSPRTVRKRFHRNRSRSRSRSPLQSERSADKRRLAGRFDEPCRDFADGQCRDGSECRFFHEGGGRQYNGSDYARSRGRCSDYRSSASRDQSEHYQSRQSQRRGSHYDDRHFEKSEPQVNCNSMEICHDFVKGRCARGASCRYIHDDGGSRGRWNDRDDGSGSSQRRGYDLSSQRRETCRANRTPCKFFAQGSCFRRNCSFLHEGVPECRTEGQAPDAPPGYETALTGGSGCNNSRLDSCTSDGHAVTGNAPASSAQQSHSGRDSGHVNQHKTTFQSTRAPHIILADVHKHHPSLLLPGGIEDATDSLKQTIAKRGYQVLSATSNVVTSQPRAGSAMDHNTYSGQNLWQVELSPTPVLLGPQNVHLDMALRNDISSDLNVPQVDSDGLDDPNGSQGQQVLGQAALIKQKRACGETTGLLNNTPLLSSGQNPPNSSYGRPCLPNFSRGMQAPPIVSAPLKLQVSTNPAEISGSMGMRLSPESNMTAKVGLVDTTTPSVRPIQQTPTQLHNSTFAVNPGLAINLGSPTPGATGQLVPPLSLLQAAAGGNNGGALNDASAKIESNEEEAAVVQVIEMSKQDEAKNQKLKDLKELKMFKLALVEFVKDLLKPAWKDGHLSRDAHKTIVRKVVEKVTGTISGPNVPQTKEKIDTYLTCCREKLTKLVLAYVDKYVKT